MGSANGNGGPGGIFMLDHFNFDVIGPWEADRGDQELAYDFWWHITQDVMVTSEWGKPHQFENGLVPEDLLAGKYGHQLHFWDLRKRCKLQSIDLGADQQMVLELRPAHDPNKTYGFAAVVISLNDLSANIWTWYQEDGNGQQKKPSPFLPNRPAKMNFLQCSRASRLCHLWSPTLTCHWTIAFFMSPAGVQANCSSTMFLIRSILNWSERWRSAVSLARRDTPSTMADCWAVHKWSRSAAMVNAFT
jgi:hypothetical protein